MGRVIYTVFLFFIPAFFSLLSAGQLTIHSILPDNISQNTFYVYINGPEAEARQLLHYNLQKKAKASKPVDWQNALEGLYLIFQAREQKTVNDSVRIFSSRIVPGSFFSEDATLSMIQIQFLENLPENTYILEMYLKKAGKTIGGTMDRKILTITNRREKAGQQPFIQEIAPAAGVGGDTIVLHGQNLARVNTDEIKIQFLKASHGVIIHKNDIITTITPFYTSRGSQGIDEIRFSLPDFIDEDLEELKTSHRGNTTVLGDFIEVRVMVANRPSRILEIRFLSKKWKLIAGSVSLLVVAFFLASIGFIMKKVNFFRDVLLEAETNTYSLTKFQAFLWTIVLIGSYLYVAICYGMILGNGEIPDFNASLIALMGVSYGGMVSSKIIEKKKFKHELRETQPSLRNLFSSGGEIDLARLQLFGFTIVSILVFLFTIIQSNILNGLPDIPPTLHGLLTASQAGYLTGKLAGQDTMISMIKPNIFSPKDVSETVHLIGTGFRKDMEVIVGDNDPMPVHLKSSAICSFEFTGIQQPGEYDVIIIQSDGKKIISSGAIQIKKDIQA